MAEEAISAGQWAALFDLDGVLIDSSEIHAGSWVQVFRPYGIELPPERLHRQEGRRSLDIAYGIIEDFGLKITRSALDELIERKREIYRRSAPRGLRTDATAALEILGTAGWILGLVTGSVRKNVETALHGDELDVFDVVITAESYSRSKPDPEPYLTACREIGVVPARCVVIENAPLGIASACAAGMRVVALTSTLPESDLQGADAVIDDLTELPQLLRSFRQA